MSNSAQIFEALLGTNNELRKEAQAFVDALPQTSFLEGIDFFLSGLDSANSQHAELSALLLKKKYLDDRDMIARIPKEKLAAVVEKTKACISDEGSLLFLKRLSEILVFIFTNLDAQNEMMGLIATLAATGVNSPKLKKLVMYFMEIVCEYSFNDDHFKKFSGDLNQLFQAYLADSNVEVRVAALKSSTIFLSCINDESFVKKFEPLLPLLIHTSIEAIKADPESGKTSLGSLAELTETHPKLLKPLLNDFLTILAEIVGTKALTEAVRVAAFGNIEVLCRTNPALVRKAEVFKAGVLPNIFLAMTEVENISLEEWSEELDEQIISKGDLSSTARDCLNKICPSLGVKFLFPISVPFIKELLASPDWERRYAGLMAIGILSEGSAEHFEAEIDGLLQLIFPILTDSHPKVIWAVLSCLGMLFIEFTPTIQTKYHELLMKYILAQMQSTCVKLQLRAISATINFAKELVNFDEESKTLLNYSTEILTNLMALFDKSMSTNCLSLQEEVLNCLALIAVCIGDEFAKYYSSFMPGLKSLLTTLPTGTAKQVNVRVLTIECIGFLVSAIGNNRVLFMDDLTQIMSYLINLQNSNTLTTDDPHHQSILSVYAQFAGCLKEDFEPYLPAIIDKVLKAVDIDIDVKIGDGSKEDEEDEENDKKSKYVAKAIFNLSVLGKRTLSMNTSALEQKIAGTQALLAICKHLGKRFAPYIEPAKEVIKKYFSFQHSAELRKTTMRCVPQLISICDDDNSKAYLFASFLPNMLAELEKVYKLCKHKEARLIIKQINKSLKHFKTPSIPVEHIFLLLNSCVSALNLAEKLKKALLEEAADNADCDEDQKAEYEEEYEEYNDVLQIVMEVTGYVVKLYQAKAETQIVDSIVPFYSSIFQKKNPTNPEILYAVCLFCDVLEYCSEPVFQKAFPTVSRVFLNLLKTNNNEDIVQTVVYGLGIFAKRSNPSDFNEFSASSIQAITSVIDRPDAFSKEKVICTESAIGSLGKLLLFQESTDLQVRKGLLDRFLALLPLRNDPEEAKVVHRMLFDEILKKNAFLMQNASQESLLKIVHSISSILREEPNLVVLDDEGRLLLQQILA